MELNLKKVIAMRKFTLKTKLYIYITWTNIEDHVRKLAYAERVDREHPTPMGKPKQKLTLQSVNNVSHRNSRPHGRERERERERERSNERNGRTNAAIKYQTKRKC